jgi:hypothetical protein
MDSTPHYAKKSENITSELAETHTLTVKQHYCFNVESASDEKLVG